MGCLKRTPKSYQGPVFVGKKREEEGEGTAPYPGKEARL